MARRRQRVFDRAQQKQPCKHRRCLRAEPDFPHLTHDAAMVGGFRHDLPGTILVEAIYHYSIKAGQATHLARHLAINATTGGLPFDPRCHRSQYCKRRHWLVIGGLEFQDGLVTRLMDGDVETRTTLGHALAEQPLDDSQAAGDLKPAADVMEQGC